MADISKLSRLVNGLVRDVDSSTADLLLQSLKLTPQSADPISPVEGQLYYSDGTARDSGLYVYIGGSWVPTGPLAELQIAQSGPVGEVIAYTSDTAPENFLYCDGTAVSRSTYSELFETIGTNFGAGDGSTTFNLPDLRAEFLRGQDDGRGIDSGRALGSNQADSLLDHKHATPIATSNGSIRTNGNDPFGAEGGFTSTHAENFSSAVTGDTYSLTNNIASSGQSGETRPRNVAVRYYIRHTGNSELLTATKSDEVVGKFQVNGQVTNSFSSTSFAYNALAYPTVLQDTDSAYNNTTGVYTAPRDGIVFVNAGYQVSLGSNLASGAQIILGLFKNSNDFGPMEVQTGANNETSYELHGSRIVSVSAGDTIQVYQRKAGTQSVSAAGNNRSNYFNVVYLPDFTAFAADLGAGGGASTIEINQVAHGFSVGDGIYHNGTDWNAGQADNAATLATFCVIEVVDADNFIAAQFARIEAPSHGFTIGEYYFLSAATAGLPVTAEPTTGFSNPLFFVEDANTLQVLVYRPSTVGGVTALDDIGDVSAASAANGDILEYDGSNWVNVPRALGAVAIISSDVTIAEAVYNLVDTSASRTLTLPAVAAGRIVRIKDSAGQSNINNITVNTPGAETIDGAASLTISSDYASITLVSDGTNWFIV